MIRQVPTVVALTVVTYLLGGYQFGAWPQLFPLEHIQHLAGRLPGDWYTSHAAPHWCFDHLAALIPESSLPAAFAIGWVLATLLFWFGFAALAAQLGVPELGILAAGVIGARTFFSGFGTTSLLTPYLYPSQIATAFWMLALVAALRGRTRTAGALAGVVLLVHPQVGVLAVLSLAAVLLAAEARRRIAGFVVAALIVGGFALVRLVRDLGVSEPIAPALRFDLLAVVRLPHHLIYSMFPRREFAMVAVWLAVAGLAPAKPAFRARGAWAFLAAAGALCAAGAWASSRGAPLALVELQTARMSAWVPLFAVLGSASSLTSWGAWGTLALLATPALGETMWSGLKGGLPGLGLAGLPSATAQAPILAVMITLAALSRRRVAPAASPPESGVAGRESRRPPASPKWLWIAAPVLLVAGFLAAGWRHPPVHRLDPEWIDIARRAGKLSRPGEVFLTPPDLDGFRFYSGRPIVCDFGNIAHDDLRGWSERMIAITGDSAVVAPVPRLDVPDRIARIAAAYDRNLAVAGAAIRRYGVAFVVARVPGELPAVWAEPVASNSQYVVYRVRRERLD